MLEIELFTETIIPVKSFEPGHFTRIGENLYFTAECNAQQNTANVVQLTPTFKENRYRISTKQLLVKDRMIYGKQVLTEQETRKAYAMFFKYSTEIRLQDVSIIGTVPSALRSLVSANERNQGSSEPAHSVSS